MLNFAEQTGAVLLSVQRMEPLETVLGDKSTDHSIILVCTTSPCSLQIGGVNIFVACPAFVT